MGPKPVLSKKEESQISEWVLDKAAIGYPMNSLILRQAVKGVLDQLNRPNPFKNNRPGVKWMRLFLKRHSDI
ncbi:hypothetical protein TKK_0010246 [Trichogramma kaykai]